MVCGDCTNVQFRDSVFDFSISIAVLHHMTTEKRRILALREIGRILKSGGRAMVTSWAKNQSEKGKSSNYVQQGGIKERNNSLNSQQLPIHKARTQFAAAGKLFTSLKKTSTIV